jgi:hypothetical protein
VSLKAALGLDPSDLFAAAPSAPGTAVVLDGAEVVQERDGGTVGALVGAATAAGKTTVLVVRDDAVESLADSLRARGVAKPARLAVGSLSTTEIATLVAAVPDLARLATDPRANWLLSRLGLVELLLKGAQRGSNLPETLSSEAEVFATVWRSLIRQDERIVGGIAPDDREAAVVEVARQLLSTSQGPTLNGPALAMLRSDGVLVSYDRSAAWQTGDRFGSDVLRDFASARLFLLQGLSVLAGSSAPRWAVRATRLFAQARLARVVNSGESTFAAAWAELRAEFASLAANHGARWAELPWEALLTAGWAGPALTALTPALLADSEMRGEAIRTATLRFSRSGACDAAIGAPLVDWLVDTAGLLNAPRSHHDEPAVELVVAWLRGVARLDAAGDDISEFRSLRAKIRDALIAREIDRSDSERLEALALLGADQTDASRAVLRHIAQVAPGFLATVVENFDVATTMARVDLALLMELADAYYIERPSDNPWGSSLHDDGIRGHQSSGFNTPLAAWYLGPFAPLLQRAPRHGLRLINRMLDRGARARLASLLDLDNRAGRNLSHSFEGIDLDIIGMGPRKFIGDSHAWSWYRGSSVGPYPCMSALLALEIAIDESARQGVTLKEVATAVLRDATTIASLGLLFGFFVRHLEEITDELDCFLASPAIWELEFGRIASEGHIHVQRGDSEQLVNVDRRRWPPVDVAARLVILAQQRGDNLALLRLRAVGLRLVEAAGGDSAPPYVQQWAAHLDAARYSIQSDGDRRVLKLDLPESVTQAMESAHQRSANVAELLRLLHRYRSRHEPPYRPALAVLPTDVELVDDYHVAQRLETEFASDIESRDRLIRSLSGVAAAIIHKASKGTDPPLESVDWALQLLIQAAIHLGSRQRDYELSFSPDGADRQAALVIPLLFADFDDGVESSADISDVLAVLADALRAGIGSPSIEVRHYAAEGLRGLKGHSCKALPDGRCWHELVWSAIEAGARATTLGERTTEGTRQIEPITGDVCTTLANTPDDDLMLSHIAPTAIAAIDAARGDSCIRGRAAPLREALLHSLARAACHWARSHYEWRSEYQAAFASALLQWSVADDPPAIVRLAMDLTQSVEALGDYLHALAIVGTHEREVVPTLTELWPQLMAIGLRAVAAASKEERHRPTAKLVRSLVPSPSTLAYVDNIDAILRTAAAHWFPMTAVTEHIQTWLKHARGEMSSVDALVGFIKTQPIETQADPGLDWIRALIVDRDGSALTCGFLLVSWLSELRDSKALQVTANPSYRATVDALVLGNFSGARDLQQRDE